MFLSQTKKNTLKINGMMFTPITGRIIREYSFRRTLPIRENDSTAVLLRINSAGGMMATLKKAAHFQS